jgi:hypothetical protein
MKGVRMLLKERMIFYIRLSARKNKGPEGVGDQADAGFDPKGACAGPE